MSKHLKTERNKRDYWVYILFSLIIVFSILYMIQEFFIKKEAVQERNLLNTINVVRTEEMIANPEENVIKSEAENVIEQVEEKTKEELKDTERILKVQKLQEENSDIVGWIEISNTTINYPVLQGKDNEYYMYHNYKKQKSKNGSIFLTKDYDWSIPSSNLLIYGHNMQNGTMFQELLRYKKEEFYKQHPIIRFTTEKEDAEYEIISVFPSRVYYKSEKNVFRYYYFVHAKNEAEYNEFVKNAKKASLYDIEATAEYGDPLLTLSTCSYHTEDGRFAVVARKRK